MNPEPNIQPAHVRTRNNVFGGNTEPPSDRLKIAQAKRAQNNAASEVAPDSTQPSWFGSAKRKLRNEFKKVNTPTILGRAEKPDGTSVAVKVEAPGVPGAKTELQRLGDTLTTFLGEKTRGAQRRTQEILTKYGHPDVKTMMENARNSVPDVAKQLAKGYWENRIAINAPIIMAGTAVLILVDPNTAHALMPYFSGVRSLLIPATTAAGALATGLGAYAFEHSSNRAERFAKVAAGVLRFASEASVYATALSVGAIGGGVIDHIGADLNNQLHELQKPFDHQVQAVEPSPAPASAHPSGHDIIENQTNVAVGPSSPTATETATPGATQTATTESSATPTHEPTATAPKTATPINTQPVPEPTVQTESTAVTEQETTTSVPPVTPEPDTTTTQSDTSSTSGTAIQDQYEKDYGKTPSPEPDTSNETQFEFKPSPSNVNEPQALKEDDLKPHDPSPAPYDPDKTIKGSVMDSTLEVGGETWHLVENGTNNIEQLMDAQGYNGDIDQDLLKEYLQKAENLYAAGELNQETYPDLYNLFHLSNGTESLFSSLQNEDTLNSLSHLGVIAL